LHVHGRRGDFIKIGGESVDLARLDRVLDSVRGGIEAALIALPDDRLGHVIHVASTGESDGIMERFNERVMPFERIRGAHRVRSITRSSLGKLLRAELTRSVAKRDDDRDAVQEPQRKRD